MPYNASHAEQCYGCVSERMQLRSAQVFMQPSRLKGGIKLCYWCVVWTCKHSRLRLRL